MVERPELARVVEALKLLDHGLLRDSGCWFAGGSAIALRCGGYRLSRDVDFLCASRDGYRALRQRVFSHGGRGLFGGEVDIVREVRVDRYGIRLAFQFEGQPLKLELVSEGRIDLAGEDDPMLPVARLRDVDLVAEKLLANADRHQDDAAMGRDVLDLIMLEHALGELPQEAWTKATEAYGDSVEVAWHRALRRLRERPAMRARWFEQMVVSSEGQAIIEARLAALPAEDPDQ